jgi:hypothetical protein
MTARYATEINAFKNLLDIMAKKKYLNLIMISKVLKIFASLPVSGT